MLFELDMGDHASCTRTFRRDSARAIIIRGGRIAMVRNEKYGYYKFPGGGIEKGEDPVSAMIRETREEAGLTAIRSSVREYGLVHRVNRSVFDRDERFVQDNYYYVCDAEESVLPPCLDDYEKDEGFSFGFVDPDAAIRTNRAMISDNTAEKTMCEREARVLEMLKAEGYFDAVRDS